MPSLFSVNWEIHKLQERRQQSYVESGETQKLARLTVIPWSSTLQAWGPAAHPALAPSLLLVLVTYISLSPVGSRAPVKVQPIYNSSRLAPTALWTTLQVVGPQKIDGKTDFPVDVTCYKNKLHSVLIPCGHSLSRSHLYLQSVLSLAYHIGDWARFWTQCLSWNPSPHLLDVCLWILKVSSCLKPGW